MQEKTEKRLKHKPFSPKEMKDLSNVVKQTAQAGKKRIGRKKSGAGKSGGGRGGRASSSSANFNLTGTGQHRLSDSREEYVLSPFEPSNDHVLQLVLGTQYISYLQMYNALIWVYIDGDMVYYQADGDDEYHKSCSLYEPTEADRYRRIVRTLQSPIGVVIPPSPDEEAAPGRKKPITTMQEVS